eukprot:11516637-Alexandrium_andersonii.AAC.1
MSASLVGSEMCIRDSHRPLTPPTGASRGGPSRGLPPPGPPPRGAARAGAVSYTHLTLPTICSV